MLKTVIVLAMLLSTMVCSLAPQAFALSADETNRYKELLRGEMKSACQQGIRKEAAGMSIAGIEGRINKYCDCASSESLKLMNASDYEAIKNERLYQKKPTPEQSKHYFNIGVKAAKVCQEVMK